MSWKRAAGLWTKSREWRIACKRMLRRTPACALRCFGWPSIGHSQHAGRYIYVSRRLLEICRTDEAVAFLIAHEVAHHRLGHLDTFPEWLADIPGSQIPILMQALYRSIEARLYGPEAEVKADLLAIDLCVKGGYPPNECLEMFDVLEKVALDMRDVDIVFGPDEADNELDEDAPFSTKLRIWIWQRTRGYLPLRDRRNAIVKHLGQGTAA